MKAKGGIFIACAMLIFGFNGIFIRYFALPPSVILFFSSLFVTIVLSLSFLKKWELFKTKGSTVFVLLLGATFVGNNLSYFTAFKLTTISNAILSHYSAPIFVAILAPFILKERLEKVTFLALPLSFLGLFLMIGRISLNSEDLLGVSLGALSGLMYALSIIIYKYLSPNLSPYTLVLYQSLFGTVILTPLVLHQPQDVLLSIPILLLFALVCGILATRLHLEGIKRVKAQYVGILGYVEPVAGSIYALLFFGEIPTYGSLMGGILIILGGLLVLRKGLKEDREKITPL